MLSQMVLAVLAAGALGVTAYAAWMWRAWTRDKKAALATNFRVSDLVAKDRTPARV